MQVFNSHTIPTESSTIAILVKNQLLLVDETASVILFGSRARGDAANESDWDFLILTQHTDTDSLANELRRAVRKEVELKHDVSISLIIKNATLWETDYSVTNIYESIHEEGILL